MGDLHSTKCIIYANLYILNMEKIPTYNPIRSAGCVTGENKEKTAIKIAFQLCTIFSAIFTFHATLMNCPCQFNLEYLLYKGRY